MKNQKLKKTKINSKIINFAKKFNIEFRVGPTFKSCKIICREMDIKTPACYLGDGIIFVRSETPYFKEDLDIVCLHEIGHAILDLFPLTEKHYNPIAEVSANMVALTLAAQLRLPITDLMIRNFNQYNKDLFKNFKK